MKKFNSSSTRLDPTEILVEFGKLAVDLDNFCADMKREDYADFINRISAVVKLNAEKFRQFVDAAGLK